MINRAMEPNSRKWKALEHGVICYEIRPAIGCSNLVERFILFLIYLACVADTYTQIKPAWYQ